MGATFVVCHRVYLIKNQRSDTGQTLASTSGSKQYVERLWGGDQDMGRAFCHLGAVVGLGVPGAHDRSNLRQWCSSSFCQYRNFFQWCGQVFLDVVGEGFQG